MFWEFDKEAITFCLSRYANGGTAIEARCEDGVYAVISVNMPDAPPLPEGQFYLKNWSENERIARAMIAEGIIEAVSPPVRAHSGFIMATAYRFSKLGMQYCEKQPEENETFHCAQCYNSPMESRCSVCGRVICAAHTHSDEGKRFCPEHKPSPSRR